MHHKGFTFIQVSIAALILGIGLIPALNIFRQSNLAVYKSQAILDASLVAQGIIDEIKGDVVNLDSYLDKEIECPDPAYPQLKISDRFQKLYQGKATLKVTIPENHTIPDRGLKEDQLRQIMVEVFWVENNDKKSTRLVAYHARLNSFRLNAFNRFK